MCKPQIRRQVCRGFAQCATGLLLLLLENIDHLNYRACHHDDHQGHHHYDRDHEGQDNQNCLCAAVCSLLLLIIFITNHQPCQLQLPVCPHLPMVALSSFSSPLKLGSKLSSWFPVMSISLVIVFAQSIKRMITMIKPFPALC